MCVYTPIFLTVGKLEFVYRIWIGLMFYFGIRFLPQFFLLLMDGCLYVLMCFFGACSSWFGCQIWWETVFSFLILIQVISWETKMAKDDHGLSNPFFRWTMDHYYHMIMMCMYIYKYLFFQMYNFSLPWWVDDNLSCLCCHL